MSTNQSAPDSESWSDRLDTLFCDFVGVDLRTLAVFRMVAGITILWMLAILLQDVEVFFTDRGVSPREHWLEQRVNTFVVSLHMIGGELWWQYLLFGAQAVFAVMLIVGYKTRLASVMSWILLISLIHRLPPITHRGDSLLCLLLLWGTLTPWGARFSIDAASYPVRQLPQKVTTFATAGLMLQMPVVYLAGALLKLRSPAWKSDFTAVAYAMGAEYVTPIGQFLGEHTPLVVVKFLTVSTLVIEGVGPILIFMPLLVFASPKRRRRWLERLRLVAIAALTLLQLGLLLTVAVGLFPLISTLGLIPLIPDSVWRRWSQSDRVERARELVIFYEPDHEFFRKLSSVLRELLLPASAQIVAVSEDRPLPDGLQAPSNWFVRDPSGRCHNGYGGLLALIKYSPWAFPAYHPLNLISPIGERIWNSVVRRPSDEASPLQMPHSRAYPIRSGLLASAIAALLLMNLLHDNLDSLQRNVTGEWKTPATIRDLQFGLRIHQNWEMFAAPHRSKNHYVIMATMSDESEHDLYDGGPISASSASDLTWTLPENPRSRTIYANYRWRLYFQWLRRDWNEPDRMRYAAYICQSWNRQHAGGDHQLEQLRFYRLIETDDLLSDSSAAAPQKQLLVHHSCSEEVDGQAR